MQNIVVIGRVYSKLEHSEFSSNFGFDRNMLSGTGARSAGLQSQTGYDVRVLCCDVFAIDCLATLHNNGRSCTNTFNLGHRDIFIFHYIYFS